MIEKVRGTKRPITLRRVLTTAAVLFLFALVLVTPAAANVAEVSETQYGTLQAAIDAASDGATITLLKDTAETKITVAADDKLTIDLNGNTVTGAFMVYGQATIKNGVILNTAFVSGIESNGASADLTVEDLIVTSNRHALCIDGGKATIESGTYTSTVDGSSCYAVNVGSDTMTTELTINGGKFYGSEKASTQGTALQLKNGQVTTTINGGEFYTGKNQHCVENYGTMTVTGGAFIGTIVFGGTNSIKGGTFSESLDSVKKNLVDDHVLIESDGKYVVKNFQTAVNEAGPGTTITVVSNVTLTNGLTIAADDKITLDLGTNTINGYIYSEGILSVKGGIIQSLVEIGDDKETRSSIESNGASAELTLEDVTATSKRHALRIDGGEATIISGTYTTIGRVDLADTVYALNAGGTGAPTTSVTIIDGTFNGIDYEGKAENPDSGSAVNAQAGATVTIENGNFAGGQTALLGTSNGGSISVTGGTYDQDPSSFVTTEGYAAFPNDAVTPTSWEVKEGWIITWVDENNNVLEKKPVEANTNPVFTGTVTPKQGDEKYTYRFDNIWNPTVGPAVKEETYEAVYTLVPVQYTLTFVTGEGASTIDPIKQGYGTEITAPENPKKDGYSFIGWTVDENPADVPPTMPDKDMTFVAQWVQTDYSGFVYALGAVPEAICEGDTLSIPIDFTNNENEAVPTVWYIDVTVIDAKSAEVQTFTSDLTVATSYYAAGQTEGFNTGTPNEFTVYGPGNAEGEIPGLFTLTIKNLKTADAKYTVKINILSGVHASGADHTEAPTLLTTQVLVQDQVSMVHNFYSANEGHEQWSLDTKAWAKITIKNNLKDGVSLTTKQLNTLVTRGHFDLTLLGSGDYVVFKDDGANAPEEITPTPGITTDANGYLVLDVTGHQDAEKFIIEFTGRKVGDVSNLPSKPDRVDGADADYMLHHFTENLIKDEYLVYGDIDMDGSIGTADATIAYLKGVNKLEKVKPGEEQKFLLVKLP